MKIALEHTFRITPEFAESSFSEKKQRPVLRATVPTQISGVDLCHLFETYATDLASFRDTVAEDLIGGRGFHLAPEDLYRLATLQVAMRIENVQIAEPDALLERQRVVLGSSELIIEAVGAMVVINAQKIAPGVVREIRNEIKNMRRRRESLDDLLFRTIS